MEYLYIVKLTILCGCSVLEATLGSPDRRRSRSIFSLSNRISSSGRGSSGAHLIQRRVNELHVDFLLDKQLHCEAVQQTGSLSFSKWHVMAV
ncbi:unnamed protein product [Pleuronectes platessa]|uniref:Uncharacterized protein n=1 Tax=Pleuronectes platessa TaxID=8262 RepID=A0A9N7U4Q8_PLEPL|nr:unnamed protein product [Pleuronectes platessa]